MSDVLLALRDLSRGYCSAQVNSEHVSATEAYVMYRNQSRVAEILLCQFPEGSGGRMAAFQRLARMNVSVENDNPHGRSLELFQNIRHYTRRL
jgi:hypothetical protein